MRAVFLDRDGVICENRADHVTSWRNFRFLPGVLPALAMLAQTEFGVVVVTNQAIINRGLVTPGTVDDIHRRMLHTVQGAGGRVDRVSVCPHRPDEYCACRKPQPGMILRAAAELDIDLARSYMIGDATTDMEAGLAAGCSCFMVMTGRGWNQSSAVSPEQLPGVRYARDLRHAVQMIVFLEVFGDGHPALVHSTHPPLAQPAGKWAFNGQPL